MFLTPYEQGIFDECFPRARGDVPLCRKQQQEATPFSPRTRGCSALGFLNLHRPVVFPAHAGMFRNILIRVKGERGFPRARGDVPVNPVLAGNPLRFSPRTRGCSSHQCRTRAPPHVFPAHAGMFLSRTLSREQVSGFPRARGDVPKFFSPKAFQQQFSPRTRGCSPSATSSTHAATVFPAHAGMFLIRRSHRSRNRRFPRARGDVPFIDVVAMQPSLFSPRTRGCSCRLAHP